MLCENGKVEQPASTDLIYQEMLNKPYVRNVHNHNLEPCKLPLNEINTTLTHSPQKCNITSLKKDILFQGCCNFQKLYCRLFVNMHRNEEKYSSLALS